MMPIARPRHKLLSRSPLLIGLLVALGANADPHAQWLLAPLVDTVFVTSCDDAGPGTLREAVANATEGEIVDLGQLTCSTITLTTGQIDVDVDELQIISDTAVTTIDGRSQSRIFDHRGTIKLSLRNLALRNGTPQGNGDGNGGCVRSNGSVYLSSSSVTSCHATQYYSPGKGGGIYAEKDLILLESRVIDNTASGAYAVGGGAFAGGAADVTRSTISGNAVLEGGFAGGLYVRAGASLYGTTISNNSAGDVGGVFLAGQSSASLNIVSSTISGNEGDRVGGVLAFQLPLRVVNSTIALNRARTSSGAAGGVAINTSSVISSSIIARNTAAGNPSDIARAGGGSGTPQIAGNANLIMHSALVVPVDTLTDDPQLMPLADRGGLTQTHAIASGSTAIDHGLANTFSYDQRGIGYMRTMGANADIGAYEFGSGPDRIFANDFENHPHTQRFLRSSRLSRSRMSHSVSE